MFFYIYTVFLSFLYDFDLLNLNPLSASRKSLSNCAQTQTNKGAAKSLEAWCGGRTSSRLVHKPIAVPTPDGCVDKGCEKERTWINDVRM